MNIQVTRIAKYFITALLILPSVAEAQSSPSISLFGFEGERSLDQSTADPLLFYVIINNPVAIQVKRDNQRNQQVVKDFIKTDAFKNLTSVERIEFFEQYAEREIPKFTLGSGQVAVEDLINFLVKDDQGNTIEISIRALAGNDHEVRAIDLFDERSLYYQFVIESDQLKKLLAGTYYFVASVDTTQTPGMWNGWFYSRSMSVALSTIHPDPDWNSSERRLLLQSNFLVDDQQYKKAADHARSWLQQYPNSVDGWSQLGEAQLGLGQNSEALEAFNTAIDRFRSKHGDTPVELPQEILDRIREIEEG